MFAVSEDEVLGLSFHSVSSSNHKEKYGYNIIPKGRVTSLHIILIKTMGKMAKHVLTNKSICFKYEQQRKEESLGGTARY